jgi:ABC-2 type transport system permease protein
MANLRRIINDVKFFGRGYLRNRVGLFFGLVFPVILILVFGAVFSGSSGTIKVYVQNQDNGQISILFLNALENTGTVKLSQVNVSENFPHYLSDHSASDGIILPPNFSSNYIAGNPVNITVYGNPAQSSSTIVSGAVNGVINAFNLQYYGGSPVVGMTQTTVNEKVHNYIDFLVPGLIGFSVLVNPMFSLVEISSEYKKRKLFKQLSLTPLSKIEWLASKVMWYIILSIASFLLMVAVGVAAFGAHIYLSLWLVPFLILGPMLFASLGMLVGTVAKTPETASVVGNVVTFPMMFLAGTFFPISIMPVYLQTFAHVLPLFYIIDGLNSVMVYSNLVGAMIDLVVVGLMTLVVFVAAAKLFKWRED